MQKVTLYQIDSKNKVREWSVEVIDNGNGTADMVVLSGLKDGKLIETRTTITEGKNAGKANATTAYQQACNEAQSDVNKKTTKGYVSDLSNVKSSAIKGSGIPAPMLAHKFDPTMKQSSSKNLKKIGIENQPVLVGDKLDGNRCLAHVTLNGTTLYTRSGKTFPVIQHIQDQLTECFQKIYKYVNEKYGVTEYWVDGELFTQKYSFNKVNGILKRGDKDDEAMKIINDVQYHVYDVVLPVCYSTRYKIIQYFKHTHLDVVKSEEIIATDANLFEALEDALNRGQEGIMIRRVGIPYENKRSWSLIKYKVFEDAEFEIIGFKHEKNNPNTLGSIQFKMDDGKTFYARFKGTDDEQKEIWDNQHKYLGIKMTVEYFGFSLPEEGGLPRFPIAKGQRVED